MHEAYTVVKRWGETFNAGKVSAVAALYAADATIWGTFGQSLTSTPRDIERYFVEADRAGLRVRLGDHVTSPISETCAVDAGHYEFSRSANGQTTLLPARYSLVLVKQSGGWMIAHHHSSIMPKSLG